MTQGERLPAISRFACARIGNRVFLHTYWSTDSILVLDVAEPAKPLLATTPVKPDPQSGSPSSRGLHSLTAVGGVLYLYGGAPQKGPMVGDLWALNTSSMQWNLLHPEPAANGWTPHPRCSHGAAALDGRIYFLAGSYYKDDGSGLQPTSELFAYNVSSNQWELFQANDSASNQPFKARNAHIFSTCGSDLLAHGGWDPFKRTYNDTFVCTP
ncbi:hypothetical protein WJX74_006897 [Apatococcus lobatus]|uniref:Uncharacterized protein n=1 Tax=Apatococcus lobatus TaxID=904363 RepID=A0AAW1QNI5_9CHLO